MSEKKRNTATQVYQDAVLSSFSEREMEFARRVSNSSVEIINPSILSEFKFAKPSYDSNGNIVDFTVSGLPGVDANGKPTKQTTDWLLSELDNSRFDSRAAFIKLPGGRGTISIGEASAIVRSRHGIDFLQSVGPKGKTNYYEFGTVSSPTSFSKMQSYIKEHTIARELLTTINNSVEERERLINNGDMILSQEERFVPGPSGNKVSVGPSETYVYRPGLPNAGKTFDFNTPVQNILSKYGITPGTKEATSVGKEMDQLASGLKTRNEADGTRLDRNGNVQGGPTSEMAKILVPAVDENGKQKTDSSGNIIYEVSKGVGVVKKTAASVTLGGILTHELGSALASAPSEIRLFAKFLGNAEHWIVGHGKYGEGALPMGNKLIYLKMLYGAIKVYKGEGDAYNNPVTPFALHAFIHFLSGQLTKTGVRVPLRLSGWGNFLEVVWISSEFTWEFAIKPTLEEYRKSRERNETDAKLWQEALSIGCYPPRYVESGGSACIRCQTTVIWDPISKKKIPVVDYGPSVTLNSNIVLPIGVERDKDGNIIYVDDPLDRNPIKRKIPKYIYPQPKPVPPVNENGTSRGLPNQSTTRNGRSVFTPFNFRIGRDATSVEKYCFSGETLISTPNGKLEIRDLNIGDSVLSFDSNLNVTSDVISNVFKHSDSNIYEYKLSNGVILNATENHPVLVNGVEFKEISKVNDDEFLIDESNEKVFIVDKKYLRKDFSYNIEVKNNNTYMCSQ